MKSYLFKIFFAIVICFLGIILSDVSGFVKIAHTLFLASTYPDTQHRILLVWKKGMGEQEFVRRFECMAKRDGVALQVYQYRCSWCEPYLRSFLLGRIREKFQPDFALHLDGAPYATPGVPSYLLILNRFQRFIHQDRREDNLKEFSGILHCAKDTSPLELYFAEKEIPLNAMPAYPTAHVHQFQDMSPPKRDILFYCGAGWDDRRKSDVHKRALIRMESEGYLRVYGRQKAWTFLKTAYQGFLPSDGISFLEAIHDAGVVLIFHSVGHIESGSPSGRIFEAVAAKAVVLSDRHPFIEENFGDNVLYVDETDDSSELFTQINQHMEWVRDNPQEAYKKAQNCHEIFKKKFSLERQFQRLVRFNRSLVKEAV